MGSNEDNCSFKMDLKNEYLCLTNGGSYPNRFSPEINENLPIISNQDFSSLEGSLDNFISNCEDGINIVKSSNLGLPTTSRNISKETKLRISTDDDTHFDIFDYMKCSDDEVTDCSKSYCDKDDLTPNEDLVNKYEKNLGLDIVKDKNICWAAGNFDSEVCPLKNYDVSNENSLTNFPRESPDDESRDSFSKEWVFDENIDCVSDEQVPDPHIIVPKKTVDITKIKGWRKKQFTVEKCLANRNSLLKNKRSKSDLSEKGSLEDTDSGMARDDAVKEEQNKDYAFVCDKLDDFLNEEAELKINYEIPHLYAEYGIKLTSEEIVSRPKFKLSTVMKQLPMRKISQNILPQTPRKTPLVSADSIRREEMESSGTSLVKKSGLKTKCAFPNKSHKNWSLWKENNLSKGKPMSLLKRELSVKKESTAEVSIPCRRSDRISQAALNKTNALVSPAANEREVLAKDRVSQEVNDGDLLVSNSILDFGNEYKFQIRKFGMVLYPGPSAPLNPFIMYHLQKIRSYRTLIDKRWANFAVSAVVQKGKIEERKRMILPLTCCFKYKNENVPMPMESHCKVETDLIDECSTRDRDSNCDVKINVNNKKLANNGIEKTGMQDTDEINKKEILESSKLGGRKRTRGKRRGSAPRLSVDSTLTKKINDGKFDLYEEEIKCDEDLKKEMDAVNVNSNYNSSENMKNSYDRDFCSDKCDIDIVFEKRRQKSSIRNCLRENLKNSPEVIDIEDDDTDFGSAVCLSLDVNQTAFTEVIAKLLSRKLNELKQTDNVTNSIDNLKTVKLNSLELIKLNFIKENYLSGYINLWYMKMPDTGKSRVFLTFAMNPPVDGAINLKMMSRCSEIDPPDIVQEIISLDKVFDPNDFAILYCDGKNWEIHGSLNFATEKIDSEMAGSNKIQVFHLTKKVFPELEILHEIKQKNDKNKVLKWWVMHMMQDYTEITIMCGNKVGRISRSIIIKTWKTKVPSFIEFKGLDNVRPIGVGVNPRLWPYFLIGPYHMRDHHNLTLKLNSKTIPFEYYLPLDRVNPAFLLKRFVSSVIIHSWRNGLQVVGMWLYDRTATKQSSFIQVKAKVKKSPSYKPSIEHDYSLSSVPGGRFESEMSYNLPPRGGSDKNNSQSTREVFLVSDIPNLGYIKGELHPDQSITIEHPLKPERKRNSHRIGDWLNRIMRKRIKFYPNDFYVKWKVVKNAELIRNLQPLDRSSLGGTHILCKKGMFYLLSLTKEKIAELELDENVVMDAVMNNPIIQEVIEVKELGKILLKKDSCDLPISDVLQMALQEIEKLEKEDFTLRKSRVSAEQERAKLCRKLLEALDGCQMDENSKRTIDFYITGILESRNGIKHVIPDSNTEKENYRRLEAISKFLQNLQFFKPEKSSELPEYSLKEAVWETPGEKISREKLTKDETEENAAQEERFEADGEKVRELESKIRTLHKSLNKMIGDNGSLRELLTERLNVMSQHLEKLKKSRNTNGKLSPVIEGIVCSAPERSDAPSCVRKEGENVNMVEFDMPSLDLPVGGQDKGSSLNSTGKFDNGEENNNENCGLLKNSTESMVSVTEDIPPPVRGTSPKNCVKERPSTEKNQTNLPEEDSKLGGTAVEEVALEEPETVPETSNPKYNGFGVLPNSAERSPTKASKTAKIKEAEVEGGYQGKKIAFLDEISLKTWKNAFIRRQGKCLRKRVRLTLLKPNSLVDEMTGEKFNGRIEYLDGKQVLIVSKKRKRGGRTEFLKKFCTS